MNTLRDRTILAVVSDVAQRESVVWPAWTIAVTSGARLHVAGHKRAPDSAAVAWRAGGGTSIDPHAGSCLEAARRFAMVERPAMVVADWPEGTLPEDILRLVSTSNATGVFVRWPQGSRIGRVLVPIGGGGSAGQLWLADEIADRHGCPLHALHVVSTETPAPWPQVGDFDYDAAIADVQARAGGVAGVQVSFAHNALAGILANVQPDDLVVVGAPSYWRIPAHFDGSIPDQLARTLPNPLIMLMGRKPPHVRLREVFWPQMIRLGLRAGTKEEAIALLVDTMVRHSQVPREWRDRLLAKALARERVMSTGVGNETALPHITLPDCGGVAGCLGIFPAGLDFGEGDGCATRFVFLFVTPEDCYDEYLEILARVATRMVLPALRQELLCCKTPLACPRHSGT